MTKAKRPGERAPIGGLAMAIIAAVIVFVLGMLVTTSTAMMVRDNAHRDAESQFRQDATQRTTAVERQVEDYFDKLRDVGAFFSSTPDPSAAQVQGYVRESRTFEQLPSLAGLLFLQQVPEADYPAFVKRMEQTHPEFKSFDLEVLLHVTHQPGQPYVVLTHWIKGPIDLQLPVGTNVTPISSLTNLLKLTADSHTGVAGSFQSDSLLIEIANATNFPAINTLRELDFFVGLPVYAPAASGTERGELIGWVGAAIDNFQQVVDAAKRGQPADVGLQVSVDVTDAALSASSAEAISLVAKDSGTAGPRDGAPFEVKHPFTVEGLKFDAAAWSARDADRVPVTVPLIFVGGALASLFAGGVAYLRVRARDRERAFAAELADRAQFQRDIVDSVTHAMVVLDSSGRIVASNPAWSTLRGPSELPTDASSGGGDRDDPSGISDLGRDYLDIITPKLRAGSSDLSSEVSTVLSGESETVEVDVPIEHHGLRRWFSIRATPLRGARGGAVVVHTDITERKRSHDELEFKASRDNLTGLLNRSALEAEVESALVRARAEETSVAVLFIDLDGFKAVNDRYGHAVGDDVLRAVAQRISGAVRTSDRVARLGGDEFVVLVSAIRESRVAETTADRILRAIDAPIRVNDLAIRLGASVGVAVVDAPLGGADSDLLDQADQAMYAAKQGGGGRYRLANG